MGTTLCIEMSRPYTASHASFAGGGVTTIILVPDTRLTAHLTQFRSCTIGKRYSSNYLKLGSLGITPRIKLPGFPAVENS